MEKKFIVECRYEHWTNIGKVFSNWYIFSSNEMTETEANDLIKNAKSFVAGIDKSTKLKHEYRIHDYNEYLNEQKKILKENKKIAKAHEAYLKSDAYKELLKKKRQSAKERKERQKKYLEEHGM